MKLDYFLYLLITVISAAIVSAFVAGYAAGKQKRDLDIPAPPMEGCDGK